jgi:hypothetical protein
MSTRTEYPDFQNNQGKLLKVNPTETDVLWDDFQINELLPDQSGETGKSLNTDGTNVYWEDSVYTVTGNVVDNTDANNPVITAVVSVTGTGVDNSDPENPVINFSGDYVGLTGNETVDGVKTFTSFPVTPSTSPSTSYEVTNKQYVDGLVGSVIQYRGGYDASSNVYPSTGGSGVAGAILAGDMWAIITGGTLDGIAVVSGDLIIAKIDNATNVTADWNILSTNISYVPEDEANKVTSISGASTNVQYPSAKLLYDQLVLKADDNAVVKLTGNQTVAGIKTFSSFPVTPSSTPTTQFQVANKVYVDNNLSALNDKILKIRTQSDDTTLTPSIFTATNYYITAQNGPLTIANPTLNTGNKIIIYIYDDGSAQTIAFGTDYKAFVGNPLPTTTTVGKWTQIIIDKVDTNVVFVSSTVEA